MSETLTVSQRQVLNFRLAGQHLNQRLPAGSLLEAAEACGIRNTPPGSAILEMNTRVGGITRAAFEQATAVDKELLNTWSIANNTYFFPTRDLPVFTSALLPDPSDEQSWRFLVRATIAVYDKAGVQVGESIKKIGEVMGDILAQGPLPKGELSTALSQRVPQDWLYWCQGCGAYHVPETSFRLGAWWGGFCITPGDGKDNLFIRTDRWLEEKLPPEMDRQAARRELLRRYLRCYGPSTVTHFAEWAGIASAHAREIWQLLQEELVEVNFAGKQTWLHREDAAKLQAAPSPRPVVLLPPYDPYLMCRDRETFLPDKTLHKKVWNAIGNPGVLLVEGIVTGIWRPQKKGKHFLLKLEAFAPLSREVCADIEAEAQLQAPLRGCVSSEVSYS